MVTLEDIFRARLPFLGIRHIVEPQGLKKPFSGLSIKCSRSIRLAHHQEGAIIILSCGAKEKLLALPDPISQEFFSNLIFCKTALLIFAQSMTWPASLKKQLKQHHLPAVISSLHENHLESRIKAILQEKINKRVTVHGVALEIQGRGILITGASGIGKTTAALEAMSEGYAWIADDLAVIQKKQSGQLMISGHRKIKKYFHTGETGIIAVDHVLNAAQIKTRTALSAVIDVIRTDADDVFTQFIEKNILETRLPCLRIGIPRAGYFNKSLLKRATQKLKEVG